MSAIVFIHGLKLEPVSAGAAQDYSQGERGRHCARQVVLAFLQELLSRHCQFPSPESQMQYFILWRWFNVFLSPTQPGRSACLQPFCPPLVPFVPGAQKNLAFGNTVACFH